MVRFPVATSRPLVRAALLALALIAGLQSQAAQGANACGNGGIGGTGNIAEQAGGSGMGGTGAVAREGSGVGGTGAVASGSGIGGTGIVGTITGFGSICVNGVEIHYGRATPLRDNGLPAPLTRLAIGQVVAVDAAGSGDQFTARHIRIVHAVTGPITHIDRRTGFLRVLGQSVQMDARTRVAGLSATADRRATLRVGDYVEVSGLRRADGVIAASLIRHTPPRSRVSVTGPVTASDRSGIHIYGLVVPGRSLPRGTAVRMNAILDHGRLRDTHIDVEPTVPFGGRLTRLELEGYLHAAPQPDALQIGHVKLRLTPATRVAGGDITTLAADKRVRVSAHLNAQRQLIADRIELERDRPDLDHTGPAHSRRHDRVDHESDNTANHERPHADDSVQERPSVERPEVERPEVETPEIELPEIDPPEVETPD
jgi:hypothetical protein